MLNEEQRRGLDVALNEADLLGCEVDPERRIAAATFRVLTLPEEGTGPDDRRVQLLFRRIGRVAASLRDGRWDDPGAAVVPFALSDLLKIVESFGGGPVYGWEFIDVHDKALKHWGARLSLNWISGPDGLAHSITVFQDGGDRHLDLCIWFDDLEIRDPAGNEIVIDAFIAGGRRWWDGFYAGDERTRNYGMTPLK